MKIERREDIDKMTERLGLLGGSFNPVHIGHLMMAEGAREALHLDKVLFIPAPRPPHKDESMLVGIEHRVDMLRRAIADNEHFELCDIEIQRPGKSYTIDTLRELRGIYGEETGLYFIIGSDSIHELPQWKEIDEIIKIAEIVPIMRPGHRQGDEMHRLSGMIGAEAARRISLRFLRIPLVNVSSTDVRQRISTGKSIRYLVPDVVRAYIEENGLYTE